MARFGMIKCEVVETELTNDYGRTSPGVEATCSKCGHVTESFGVEDGSVKRCLALMREECPNNEKNFYDGDIEIADPYFEGDENEYGDDGEY